MDITQLRQCVHKNSYEISRHAEKERYEEDITLSEIEEAVLKGEIIEDYPNDPRGPSCLIVGYSRRRPVHIVCSLLNDGWMRIITVYIPKPPKWLNPRKRSR